MKKRLTLIIILSLLLLIIAGGIFGFYYLSSPVSKIETSESVRIEVPQGKSIHSIAEELQEKNIIRNSKLFYISVRVPKILKIRFKSDFAESFVLKSGIYYLKPSMNYAQILEELSSGKQEYTVVSFKEGLTISETARLLGSNGICSEKDFIDLCYDSSYVKTLGIASTSLEGYLFPDTYYFTPNISAKEVIEIMIKNFFNKIQKVPNLYDKSPEELNEIVKLASVVEKEYKVKDEAPIIASVFKNRLRYNIGLYSCATVVYIITEVQGKPHPSRVLIEDTKIDSPYNTYLYAGLPPTAISNPGLIALDASTNTPKTSYYYFQVKDETKGTHIFTKTFEEHIENH